MSTLRTVLITGAAGRIGSFLTRRLQGRYTLTLTDIRPPEEGFGYPCTMADIADLDAPDDLRFGIFHGLSNNRWNRLDISATRSVLGYAPEDDAFVLAGLFPPAGCELRTRHKQRSHCGRQDSLGYSRHREHCS